MIKYNIWPGELLIIFFAHLLEGSGQGDLVYIIVFVTGVGDGLAEPVSVQWHKLHAGLVIFRKGLVMQENRIACR